MSWLSCSQLGFEVSGKTLLQPLSFELETGRSLGIIGPNGAGKSTLLRLLSCYLKASSGSVRLAGQDLNLLPARERARLLALVNPREELPPFAMLVKDYLRLGRAPWQDWLGGWQTADQKALEQVIERLQLASWLNESLYSLSSGEWQRIQLARALVQEPQLLLLDEPTSHLDLAAQLEVMKLVRQLSAEGLGIICVIHDLNLASQYMDQLILLHKSRLIAQGSSAEVLSSEHLSQAYGLQLRLETHPQTGKPFLLPDYS